MDAITGWLCSLIVLQYAPDLVDVLTAGTLTKNAYEHAQQPKERSK
jgi:hypothetical protein